MSRLIDADSLRQDILALPNCYNGFSDTYDKACIIWVIDEQQPVDAVPVVRCKDCKWWYLDADTEMACEYTEMGQPEDGYCNWAERRTDDSD